MFVCKLQGSVVATAPMLESALHLSPPSFLAAADVAAKALLDKHSLPCSQRLKCGKEGQCTVVGTFRFDFLMEYVSIDAQR